MSRIALVVDDSILVRKTVTKFLAERGYAVETASSSLDGLGVLQRIVPELIVVDLAMPKIGGAEFIREIRYQPNLSRTLVILVAGRKNPSSPPSVTGADYVVYKDVDLVEQLKIAFDKFGPGRVSVKAQKNSGAALG
jgi:CheY-like chemotaxis protein